ncbi:MAG: hypothetical protein COC01_10110 [Bacteroidetes bacterium]|nr:MAG: hypothetical protein COC01_10110 [Bacteroidota bacterium]
MKNLIIIIIVTTVVGFTNILCAQTTYYVKSNNGLNLRKGAGSNHEVVVSIPTNAKVKIINKGNDWWEVEYNNHRGFVSSKYLSESKSKKKKKNANDNNSISVSDKETTSFGYNWGVGIRLGDPSGITVKKYKGGRALEISFGRTAFLRDKGYDDRFIDRYYSNKYDYTDFQSLNINTTTPFAIQAHYVIHHDLIIEGLEGLQWYYGLGGQIRFQSYTYDYRYKLEGESKWRYATGGVRNNLDIGGDAVLGLQFQIPDTPITVFADLALFMEFIDNPFLFWFQGGLGGRYNF